MSKVAILQSNYIPWKGYFDLINRVDLFIFYDDLQYTKNDWRNRNKIKVPEGTLWLTIPCGTDQNRLICEVELKNDKWQSEHWNKFVYYYSKAPYFDYYRPFFEDIYLGRKWTNLSELNQYIIVNISREILKSKTVFDDSRNYTLKTKKADRVKELLIQVNATHYLSGPAAQSYLTQDSLADAHITLEWMDYAGYPAYKQLHEPFEHGVTILDLLFNTGPDVLKYMKSFSL